MNRLLAPNAALASLWQAAGLPADALGRVSLTGNEPALPSSFACGTAAQASIAAAALAATEISGLRGSAPPGVAVDMAHAAAEFRSERYLRVDGQPAPELWDPIAGIYACADGWVRIHTNFAHHRDGMLALLACGNDKHSVAQAMRKWHAEALEQAAAESGLVATKLRSFDEWDAHPQGLAVATQPLIALEKLDDSPPRPLPPLAAGQAPLHGLRVLDLTRIIAGPVAGRALAAYGADVLHTTAPHLPGILPLIMDTGRGKRCAALDLDQQAGRETLAALAAGADLFLQGYRPGGLAERGFGPAALAALRPGIVCASLSAYGHTGPWAGRRGFDSLTQTASGFNLAEATAAGQDTPRALPAQVLDHTAGYLLALGMLAALRRRATEGGSWHVRVSLARTGLWLRSLGRVAQGLAAPDPTLESVASCLEDAPSGFGQLRAVRHAAALSGVAAGWRLPAMPLGSHAPAWID